MKFLRLFGPTSNEMCDYFYFVYVYYCQIKIFQNVFLGIYLIYMSRKHVIHLKSCICLGLIIDLLEMKCFLFY